MDAKLLQPVSSTENLLHEVGSRCTNVSHLLNNQLFCLPHDELYVDGEISQCAINIIIIAYLKGQLMKVCLFSVPVY